MAGWETKIITAEADRLVALAADDPGLRADLIALARRILAETGAMSPGEHRSTGEDDVAACVPSDEVESQAEAFKPNEPLRELTFGRSSPPAPVVSRSQVTATEADLTEIEERCRLKADGARWAANRLRRNHEGTGLDFEASSSPPDIAAWAGRLTDCFFWANSSDAEQTPDISLIDNVAGCFDAVAEALALVPECNPGRRGCMESVLPLVARAQSALRAAILQVDGPADPDQLEVFEWLKATAARQGIYLKRFMRADELADPALWPEILDSIEVAGNQIRKKRGGSKHGADLDRLRSQVRFLRESGSGEQGWPASTLR